MTTWGDIFRKHLHRGEDHGAAAFAADQWEKRQMQKPAVEAWAEEEYREGVSPHAACRQLIRSLGCSGHYPTLKRMLEDLLADANRSSHEHAMTKDALRTVVQSVPKQ